MQQIQFIRGLHGLEHASLPRGCVATIGAFDGVHLGHQRLIETAKAVAAPQNLPVVVVIFEPQPNEYFDRSAPPVRLTSLREKVAALAECGVDAVLCLRFNATLRAMTAEAFVQEVLHTGLAIQHLVVGDDFRFGCDRKGDFNFLMTQGEALGFTVSDTHTLASGEARVSSTRIRALLDAGALDEAATLLGRSYQHCGRVKYGRQLGRTLGFPTLNVHLAQRCPPLRGVFVVEAELAGTRYTGVANVGTRPTVDGKSRPLLEVHLFDAHVDAYGAFVSVVFLQKLRDEKKFDSVDALRQQIEHDAIAARQWLANMPQNASL